MNRAAIYGALFTAFALVGGCNLAPKYHVPPVETPVGFKETNGWKRAQPSDAAIKGNWWEIFADTNLNALEIQVGVSNQNIIAALENFFAARAVAKQAHSAYFPTISVAPSATYSHTSRNGGVTVGISTNTAQSVYSAYALPLDAAWEPDLWGSIRNTVRADTYAAQASAAQLENMKLIAQAEVAEDYFELRAQDELIQLYETTVKAYRESLDLTKTLFETGIDSALDVAQADSLLETTLAQGTALGIQRAQLEHAIALLIGRPASEFALKAAPLHAAPPALPIGLPSKLLERRPDVAAAERTVAEANAAIGVARAAYFPTLNLSGGAGYQSSSISTLLNASSFYWAIGATLTETIFDAGRRKAQNEQAWAAYRSTVAQYREAVLTAFQEVEDNIASLRILAAQNQEQEVAVAASQKSVDLAMDRYRLGVNSYLNVITAQVTLLNNQQTAVNIEAQQMVAAVELIANLGGGWDESELPSSGRVLHGHGTN